MAAETTQRTRKLMSVRKTNFAAPSSQIHKHAPPCQSVLRKEPGVFTDGYFSLGISVKLSKKQLLSKY
jgi:hypothetical protein